LVNTVRFLTSLSLLQTDINGDQVYPNIILNVTDMDKSTLSVYKLYSKYPLC